jgi:hypothetical protein
MIGLEQAALVAVNARKGCSLCRAFAVFDLFWPVVPRNFAIFGADMRNRHRHAPAVLPGASRGSLE